MNESLKWTLNREDVSRWLNNAGLFLAPLAIIYLTPLTAALEDGIQLADFVPTPMVQGAMVLYLVNTLLDLFRKLKSGPQGEGSVPHGPHPVSRAPRPG